ncbi:hypothetical protein Vi05172_g2488 [Venturia inaequalis]|nr:hypothetical protein Vi05172_g2488 [Venturia inaequalis]
MVPPFREKIAQAAETIDKVLHRYFFCNKIVEADDLHDALTIFEECHRERTRTRANPSMVETLMNLEYLIFVIRDILDVWQYGPPDEEMLALDLGVQKLRVGRRSTHVSRRTGTPNFRADFGIE